MPCRRLHGSNQTRPPWLGIRTMDLECIRSKVSRSRSKPFACSNRSENQSTLDRPRNEPDHAFLYRSWVMPNDTATTATAMPANAVLSPEW